MFKSFLSLTIGILCAATAASAVEPRPVRAFEAEIGGGMTVPIDASYHNADRIIGPTFGIELRYNLKDSPWACGLFIDSDNANWDLYDRGYSTHKNYTLRLGLLGEYNLRQGHRVNPFASLGIGIGFNDTTNELVGDNYLSGKTHASFLCTPKIGVEFYQWLRVNTFFQLSRKGFNVFGASLGIVIGGRPKK